MTDNPSQNRDTDQPVIYQIRVQGHLGPQWSGWFQGLTITTAANEVTVLTGPVADQAALFSLLRKIRDVGLPLLAVCRVAHGETIT
ncbi:MAG: hypothetical protein KDD78_04540 [Caldilineaceae bacterium]|nr:hypothetical protein [Caldilineaceae bacterium]